MVGVLFAVGDVGLIEVSFHRVTTGPQLWIIEVGASSDTAIIQAMVNIHATAVVLALCGTATQTPVVKLPVPAVVHFLLGQATQARVVEGAAPPEAQIVEVKVQEAALSAGKRHKAALGVPAAQVVVVACRRVR